MEHGFKQCLPDGIQITTPHDSRDANGDLCHDCRSVIFQQMGPFKAWQQLNKTSDCKQKKKRLEPNVSPIEKNM